MLIFGSSALAVCYRVIAQLAANDPDRVEADTAARYAEPASNAG
jgi:hypothetical protein